MQMARCGLILRRDLVLHARDPERRTITESIVGYCAPDCVHFQSIMVLKGIKWSPFTDSFLESFWLCEWIVDGAESSGVSTVLEYASDDDLREFLRLSQPSAWQRLARSLARRHPNLDAQEAARFTLVATTLTNNG